MPSGEPARDTIAAIATPAGRGGIGVVRLSGPGVARIAQTIVGSTPSPRSATFTHFRDSLGQVIDEGIALYFPAPHSFTGEDVLELQGHGGLIVMQMLLAASLDAGARLAEPGEFTRRAFLEGRLDLAQAEAVADLIDAASQEAARSALRSLSGEFSAAIEALRAALVELRALTEAQLDFPEEELDGVHRDVAVERLARVQAALEDVLSRSRQGSLLRSGVHVVLAGPPNVGKSSLLNRLAGEERAIVTPIPGTTRDVLRETIHIQGVAIVLVDTAGLHESTDEIEQLGMARTRAELERADVVLAVHDATSGERQSAIPGDARLEVYNKVDLTPGFVPPPGALGVSARSGQGIAELREAIVRAAGWSSTGESTFLARERHLRALAGAKANLARAAAEVDRWELFAEELRLAHDQLGSITGAFTPDDLLGEIFSRFCIGK
jgi:tRNA modification GTPase